MILSGFNIYNASAGSGKTYQLVRSYLKLLLSAPSTARFRQLLALTFTNKAVVEMKNRILDKLYLFGNPNINKDDDPMFLHLGEELNMDSAELEKKSAFTLKLLLHNYGFFEVSTIDKFNHKVIKTFAKDLKVSQNFEVELDSELLLDRAIGRLLDQIGTDTEMEKALIAFSLEKIKAEKSWNIIYDLKNIGKLLFEEDHYNELKELEGNTITDFNGLKDFLSQKKKTLEILAIEKAQVALNTIEMLGFDQTDFSRETLPKHFKRIVSGNTNTSSLYNNRLEENLINDKVLLSKVQKDSTELCLQLLPIYLEIKTALLQRKFLDNAYGNLLSLSVLNEISKKVKEIQQEEEILHISEFNKLISKEIKNQPAPYIYERLGEKYRHYFIDEFQDTSTMQWNNLIPLIGNTLEGEAHSGEKGSLFLVGDVKQSIYRWRGGSPRQFLLLGNQEKNPFSVKAVVHNLETNWRSHEAIIDFNNDFFNYASQIFDDLDYKALYVDKCAQKKNQKKGGLVEIQFIDEEKNELENRYCQEVLQQIYRITAEGYPYSDICVLVRNNSQGVALADYLVQNKIPIVSSEALLLKNQSEVDFLVSLIRFIDNPGDRTIRFKILEYLFSHTDDLHDHIHAHLIALPNFLKSNYGFDLDEACHSPVPDILEKAIFQFNLVPFSNAYIMHLLDVALEVSEKIGVGIYDFLDYWDLKKEGLSISSPNNENALQIMTIHKSKGLEFPFVIFPFADTTINPPRKDKKLWVPLNDAYPKFQKVLVNSSKDLEHYSESSHKIYTKENHLSTLDDINVLYVALTRAIRGLFVITQLEKPKSYASLFKNYLISKTLWSEGNTNYVFGNFPTDYMKKKAVSGSITIPYIYSNKLSNALVIKSQLLWDVERSESLETGNVIHQLLANIKFENDIDRAVLSAERNGTIASDDVESYKNLVLMITQHPKLSQFFEKGQIVYNEVGIMDSKGNQMRPDRLVLDNENVTIIDYKTGRPNHGHQSQIKTYGNIMEEMGYVVSNKILVYIGAAIEPVFI